MANLNLEDDRIFVLEPCKAFPGCHVLKVGKFGSFSMGIMILIFFSFEYFWIMIIDHMFMCTYIRDVKINSAPFTLIPIYLS